MEILAVVARVALGLVFIYAGALKLRSRTFARSVEAMALVPQRAATTISRWLPRAELILGLLLLAGLSLPVVISLTSLLLLLFTTSVVISLLHKRRVECGCFGGSTRPATWLTVLRNAVLLALAMLILIVPQPELGLSSGTASQAISYADASLILTGTASLILILSLMADLSVAHRKLQAIERILGSVV